MVTNKYYVGCSHDPDLRLILHNQGATKSTKSGMPWRLVYTEVLPDKSTALKREKEIKRKKSRKFTEALLLKG
jgi:putative endonuclease